MLITVKGDNPLTDVCTIEEPETVENKPQLKAHNHLFWSSFKYPILINILIYIYITTRPEITINNIYGEE